MEAVVVVPGIDAVPPEWDAFAETGGAPVLWRAAALECAAWTAQSTPVMAVVLDAGAPVALFHARFHGPRDPRRFARPGAAPLAGMVECRLHPVALPGHRFAAGLDAAGRTEAVAAFERAVRARFRFRVMGFCYRQVSDQDLPAFRRRAGVVLDVAPDMVIRNRWSTVDDYLADLPAKWRSQLRKIRSTVRADTPGRVADDVPPGQMAELVNLVRDRHQRRGWVRPPIPLRWFELLNADPGTRFATYADGPAVLAVSAVHDVGTELTMSVWGNRDRADGGRANLYFDHYLVLVELMIETGSPALRPGKGMPEIKRRFGAEPEARYVVAGR